MNVRKRYVGKKVDPFYVSSAWRRFRKMILQRDFYFCQVCRKRWANTVHHKKSIKEYPELALDPENCESICDICHNQEHPEKGQKNGNKQLESDIVGLSFVDLSKKGVDKWSLKKD